MVRSAEALFMGSHTNRIDAKGRIASPADFRRALDLQAFNGFYCVPSLTGPHLDCGGGDYMTSLRRMIAAFDPFDPDKEALQEALIGRARMISFDGDGRFILPQPLRDHAGLADQALFVGLGDTFQIRSAAGAAEREADITARARAALPRLRNPVDLSGGGGV